MFCLNNKRQIVKKKNKMEFIAGAMIGNTITGMMVPEPRIRHIHHYETRERQGNRNNNVTVGHLAQQTIKRRYPVLPPDGVYKLVLNDSERNALTNLGLGDIIGVKKSEENAGRYTEYRIIKEGKTWNDVEYRVLSFEPDLTHCSEEENMLMVGTDDIHFVSNKKKETRESVPEIEEEKEDFTVSAPSLEEESGSNTNQDQIPEYDPPPYSECTNSPTKNGFFLRIKRKFGFH